MISIRRQTPGDAPAIEALLDDAFGLDRFEKTAQRLRDGRVPADGLAYVACEDGRIVGAISLWNVNAGLSCPALLLGPVAVDCAMRERGIGGKLIRRGLNQAASRGHGAVILVGDAPYYGRFGFTRDLTRGLVMPGPVEEERFLGLELRAGALKNARGLVVATGRESLPVVPVAMELSHARAA